MLIFLNVGEVRMAVDYAREHGVKIRPVCVASAKLCTFAKCSSLTVRVGSSYPLSVSLDSDVCSLCNLLNSALALRFKKVTLFFSPSAGIATNRL